MWHAGSTDTWPRTCLSGYIASFAPNQGHPMQLTTTTDTATAQLPRQSLPCPRCPYRISQKIRLTLFWCSAQQLPARTLFLWKPPEDVFHLDARHIQVYSCEPRSASRASICISCVGLANMLIEYACEVRVLWSNGPDCSQLGVRGEIMWLCCRKCSGILCLSRRCTLCSITHSLRWLCFYEG